MTGKLAKLQRALTQFMLDYHIEKNGYTETYAPYLVNADSLTGLGSCLNLKMIYLKPIYTVKKAKQRRFI